MIGRPLERNEVQDFSEKIRKAGKKIVFTNGCFDILHLGHVQYLKQARALADFLFVGINTDLSVKKLKGDSRPLQTENDRALILLELKSVNAVSLFSEETPLELVKLVRPDFLVKGGDWQPNQIVGGDFVTSYGGKVLSLPFLKDHSSTSIIKNL